MNRLIFSFLAIAGMLSLTNCQNVQVLDDHRYHGGSTTTIGTTEETIIRRPASSIVEAKTTRSLLDLDC